MPTLYTMVAPCFFGTESTLNFEVKRLGAQNIQVTDGRVAFQGGADIIAAANLNLRTAERVLLLLATYKATTFDELFDGCYNIAWEELLPADAAFPVKGSSLSSQLSSVPACQSIVKKAIVKRLMAGHKAMQVCIQAINELVAEAGKPAWDWQPAPKNEALVARIVELCDAGLKEAYGIRSKQARTEKLREVYAACEAQLVADAEAAGTEAPDMNEVHGILFELEAKLVRSNILNGEPRIDGRDTRTVRPIEIRQSVLPRTHGSALFTRGETQALVLTTLGTKQDEQIIDGLCEETHDRFMLHYTAAGDDPYDTALIYGYVNGALSSLAPLCRKKFKVRDADVRTDVDFTADSMSVDFAIAVTMRIGQIFEGLFIIAFGALGIIIKNKRRLAREKRTGATDTNGEEIKQIEENRQAEERMNENG